MNAAEEPILLEPRSVKKQIPAISFPESLKEEAKPLIWEDWREPLRGEAHGHGLGNYRLASVAVLITFAVLYVIFR